MPNQQDNNNAFLFRKTLLNKFLKAFPGLYSLKAIILNLKRFTLIMVIIQSKNLYFGKPGNPFQVII